MIVLMGVVWFVSWFLVGWFAAEGELLGAVIFMLAGLVVGHFFFERIVLWVQSGAPL